MIKKLSIIIPVYNEAVYIIQCLNRIKNVDIKNWVKEIVIINDNSTDSTLKLLKEYSKSNPKIKLINLSKNVGKGAALKKGIQAATGDILIIQDGDMEYDPNDYLAILKKYENKNVNIVYGSRILGSQIYHNKNAGAFFLLGGLILTKLTNIFFGTNLTDQPTCYKSWRKILSKGLINYCQSDRFEFEVEMTAYFSKINGIVEVPIHYSPRSVAQGKKIGFMDFVESVLMLFRCKFK